MRETALVNKRSCLVALPLTDPVHLLKKRSVLESLAPYRISEKQVKLTKTILGRGGFGVVVLGEMGGSIWKPKSGTPVAVKQLHATGTTAENRQLALALVQELHVWAGLAHPHIISLSGFFLDDRLDRAWFISPYMQNGNIGTYLKKHGPNMTVRLRMLRGIARGIAYLHRYNLCHGDIKAANVLVDDTGQPKLCDFGLTKLLESGTTAGATSTGLKGTTRYMAPEFFREERPVRDKKSDVWAWSCLGLEVLFDQLPYAEVKVDAAVIARITRGEPPLDMSAVVVDERIKDLFKKCWVTNPQHRVDIKSCARAVEDVLEGKPSGPRPRLDLVATQRTRDGTDSSPAVDTRPTESPAAENEPVPVARLRPRTSSASMTDDGSMAGLPSILSMESTSLGVKTEPITPEALVDNNRYDWGSAPAGQQGVPRLQDEPTGPNSLQKRGALLVKRYRKDGNIGDLYEAIHLLRQALHLRPEGHQDRHESLYSLAHALVDKYRKEADVADLHEAIKLLRQALLLRPAGHPERHNVLKGLATSMVDKYRKQGDIGDLCEAVDLNRQALELRPAGHPDRDDALYSLAIALANKCRKESDIKDLYEVINLHRQALHLRPMGHPDRHHSLYELAASLVHKYDKEKKTRDLHDAIDLYRQALVLRPAGHRDRHKSLARLAACLKRKYRKEGDVEDMYEAIELYQQALKLLSAGDPRRREIQESLDRLIKERSRMSMYVRKTFSVLFK